MAGVKLERVPEGGPTDISTAGARGHLAASVQPGGGGELKKPGNVANTSSAYDRMAPAWKRIRTLLAGTDAMRAMAQEYLPQHEEESAPAYQTRLDRAVLVNFTEQTLEQLVGMPFSEPVALDEDVPPIIEELLEDVDLQGNNLDVFCRTWFRAGVAKGFSHVLVEFPRPVASIDDAGNEVPRTLEDDRRDNVRPYWVAVEPENLIAAYAEMVNGREVLTHVRILETCTERNGFAEREVVRIRVLEPGYFWLYEQQKKDEWAVVEEGHTGRDDIPLVTFYADRQGFMQAKPPLLDLAHLNIAHWQSSSDQRHVLTVSRFPILAVSGASSDDTDKLRIGPNSWLATPTPDGKWYYVEHTGAAIEAGRKDLEDLENQMAGYGAQFLKRRSGNETATARALDSSEASSQLQAMALCFKDCVEQALQLTAEWLALEDGGSVLVKTEFGETMGDSQGGELLLKARAAREISHNTFIEEMKRRGLLNEDVDAEEEREMLAEEAPSVVSGMVDDGTEAPQEPQDVKEPAEQVKA
jgi:hypothetical protein